METAKPTQVYSVEGMHCASCVAQVETALKKVAGVSTVQVNLNSHQARVEFDQQQVATSELQQAVTRVGYDLHELVDRSDSSKQRTATYNDLRLRTLLAAPLAVSLFILSMFVSEFPSKNLLLLALASPIVLWSGRPIFVSAVKGFRHFSFNMDTLIAIGSGTAYFVSCIATFFPSLWSGNLPIYFDAAAMTIFFVMTGRLLEEKAKRQTATAIDALVELQPQTATLWENGSGKEVSISDLNVGDLVHVRPGERVPIDGQVFDGTATVDESMVTGESVPIEKREGDSVIGGTLNVTGGMIIKVSEIGNNTVLNQILELVSNAQASKAPIARLADRVAGVFVPVVIIIALITFSVWFAIAPTASGLSHAILAAVTVLVVSCPCALGLATPTAMTTAMGRAAELGLMIKDAETLEGAAGIEHVLFDKTGTLTLGKLTVSQVHVWDAASEEQLLKSAAAVEQHSEHPVAKAILDAYAKLEKTTQNKAATRSAGLLQLDLQQSTTKQPPKVKGFQNLAGRGARAEVDGQEVFVGNRKYFEEFGPKNYSRQFDSLQNTAASLIYVFQSDQALGVIEVEDEIKPDATDAVQNLKAMGLQLSIISGDRESTVAALAERVAISNFFAEVLPHDKVAKVEEIKNSKRKVAMVGDGVNDAPALAAADLGIAISTGTDAAMAAAGMTVLSERVQPIADGLKLSRRAMAIIKQNLFFAFIYNLIGIPFAAGVFYPWTGWLLPPMFAAAAMSLSSISVVLNSLRLRK